LGTSGVEAKGPKKRPVAKGAAKYASKLAPIDGRGYLHRNKLRFIAFSLGRVLARL
jgi:hypothetical protein